MFFSHSTSKNDYSYFSFVLLQMPDYQPMSTYPFAMTSSLFIGSLWYTFYGSQYAFSKLIVTTFLTQALIMFLLPFIANIGGSTAYYSCGFLLFILGLFLGVCETACFAYNAKLPSSYIAIFLTSQGLAGIFSNMVRLASLWLWPIIDGDTQSTAASSAFKACLFMQCSGILVLLLCLPAQIALSRNRFANYYFYEHES